MQSSDQWYYVTASGQQVGPMDFDALQAAARAGQFQPTDHVWHEGDADWTPAHAVPGLFVAAGPGAGPGAGPRSGPGGPPPLPHTPAGGAPGGPVAAPPEQVPAWFFGYGGFGRRLVAWVLDMIVAMGVATVLMIPFILGNEAFDPEQLDADEPMPMFNLLAILLTWLYYALFESSHLQATPGKLVLNIKVTDMYGRRISFLRASGRFFGKILSNLILGIGYLMILFTARRQALHDMLADCLVVKRG